MRLSSHVCKYTQVSFLSCSIQVPRRIETSRSNTPSLAEPDDYKGDGIRSALSRVPPPTPSESGPSRLNLRPRAAPTSGSGEFFLPRRRRAKRKHTSHPDDGEHSPESSAGSSRGRKRARVNTEDELLRDSDLCDAKVESLE